MKKYISLLLCAALIAAAFCGCAAQNTKTPVKADGLKIAAAIYPEYDWVMNILGEKADSADVTLLCSSGVDLHSFQPSADDIIKITTCDVFIYTGGESDEWAEDALKEAEGKSVTVLNLLELLGDGAAVEELAEGMQAEHDEHEDEAEEEGPEYDEHVWLSLKNAAFFVEKIKDALCEADAENAEIYTANAAAYCEKLASLDNEYRAVCENAKRRTLLFADRFPFRYLTDDYSLEYYAAFSGCSAESEASFETVAFLADKVDELALPYVLTLEGSDDRIAQTVTETAKSEGVEILKLDSMQSAALADEKAGRGYLDIMQSNLDTLKKALG